MDILFQLLVLIFFVGQIDAVTHETLLNVTSGTNVSFIDLWNLKGKNVGNTTDAIYRNGLIDRGFSFDCPLEIYIELKKLSNTEVYINYGIQNFESANVPAWIEQTPLYVGYYFQNNTITSQLRPQNGVDFCLKNSNTGKYYVTVLFDRTHCTGPTFHYCCNETDNGGYTDPFSGMFNADYLLVDGAYAGTCNISAPEGNEVITATEAKQQISCGTPELDLNFPQCSNKDTTDLREAYFRQSGIGDPTVAKSDVAWESNYGSLVRCAMMCAVNDKCNSFYYRPGTGLCTGLKHPENPDDKPKDARHYRVDECSN